VTQLVKLPDSGRFPRAEVVPPTSHRYRLLAARIDRRPFLLPASGRKRVIVRHLARHRDALRRVPGVRDANVFDAIVRAPGRSQLLERRPDAAPVPRFDVVVLVEHDDDEEVRGRVDAALAPIEALLAEAGRELLQLELTNVRSLGPVDHSRQGVFLFNFFYAEDRQQNVDVWQYTAGWFQDQTGLDNSTVLQPLDDGSPYTLINHCRWDRLRDVVVPLRTRRSFPKYVLAHFDANDTAPLPVLYRLVR
jgi:hypothetical protein